MFRLGFAFIMTTVLLSGIMFLYLQLIPIELNGVDGAYLKSISTFELCRKIKCL